MDDKKDGLNNNAYVENLGVLEIRTFVDDGYDGYHEEPVDMLRWQEKCVRKGMAGYGFDETFCRKDQWTYTQKYFFCLVCDCELKHIQGLDAHVQGKNHVRKVMQKKRKELGLPQDPPQQPHAKNKKKKPPMARSELEKINLVDRLRDEEALGQPALGLKYIHEWINPEKTDDVRRYTCTLEGCKSAWGDSDDIFRHLVGKTMLHNKNFLIHDVKFEQAAHYKRDELMKATQDYDKNERGGYLEKERDYSLINRNFDKEKYWEIRKRPTDWSYKRQGRSENIGNPNMVPLGNKRSRDNTSNNQLSTANGTNCSNEWKPASLKEEEKNCIIKLETLFKLLHKYFDSGEVNQKIWDDSERTLDIGMQSLMKKRGSDWGNEIMHLVKQKEDLKLKIKNAITRNERRVEASHQNRNMMIQDEMSRITNRLARRDREEEFKKPAEESDGGLHTVKKESVESRDPRRRASNKASAHTADVIDLSSDEESLSSIKSKPALLNENGNLKKFKYDIESRINSIVNRYMAENAHFNQASLDKMRSHVSNTVYEIEVTNWKNLQLPLDKINLNEKIGANLENYAHDKFRGIFLNPRSRKVLTHDGM